MKCHCHSWPYHSQDDGATNVMIDFNLKLKFFASCYWAWASACEIVSAHHSHIYIYTSKSSIMPQTTNLSFILSSVSVRLAFIRIYCICTLWLCFLARLIGLGFGCSVTMMCCVYMFSFAKAIDANLGSVCRNQWYIFHVSFSFSHSHLFHVLFFFVDEFDSLASNNRLLKISPLLSLCPLYSKFHLVQDRAWPNGDVQHQTIIDAIFNFCTVDKMHSQKNITLNEFSSVFNLFQFLYISCIFLTMREWFVHFDCVLIIFCRNVLKTATNCTFLDVNTSSSFFFFINITLL